MPRDGRYSAKRQGCRCAYVWDGFRDVVGRAKHKCMDVFIRVVAEEPEPMGCIAQRGKDAGAHMPRDGCVHVAGKDKTASTQMPGPVVRQL